MPVTILHAQNLVYIDQVGSYNNTTVEQKDWDGKTVTILNGGDANIFSILQQGLGSHTANIVSSTTLYPNNNNNLTITQSGTGNHTASIVMNNSSVGSNNNSATILQMGNSGADKSFSLSLTGSGIGFTGIQDNLTTPDSSSLSITCLTPPCAGYSYTKH